MSTMISSFIVLLIAVAAMAVGVLFGRAPIRGSCGGVGGCAACAGPRERRAEADNDDSAGGKEAC